MKRDKYGLTSPCAKCPFRNDIQPFLTATRVREIEAGLVRSEFPCHATLNYDRDDPDDTNSAHCAGALILLEKEERPSQMMRICERLGIYDASRLDMTAPVYDSFEEMIDAAERGFKKKTKKKSRKKKPSRAAASSRSVTERPEPAATDYRGGQP